MKIAVLVGSLRAESLNKKLAKNVEALLPDGVEFDYIDYSAVPLFNQDLEADYPASAQKVKDAIEAADAVLFVTPEYNRAIPGVLKNVIDWLSRPWGHNSLEHKPAAVIGASGSTLGTALAQTQLKSVLLYLDTYLIGQPEIYVASAMDVFDEQDVANEYTREKLKHFIERFVDHIQVHQSSK